MTSARDLDELMGTLRSEMRALDIGDAEARARLETLVADIGARIENPDRAPGGEGLTAQLKTSILRFEVSHPRLAAVMNDVLDKLGAMGI